MCYLIKILFAFEALIEVCFRSDGHQFRRWEWSTSRARDHQRESGEIQGAKSYWTRRQGTFFIWYFTVDFLELITSRLWKSRGWIFSLDQTVYALFRVGLILWTSRNELSKILVFHLFFTDTVFFMFPKTGESMFSDQRSRRESSRVPKCSLGSDLWRRDTEQMSMSRDLWQMTSSTRKYPISPILTSYWESMFSEYNHRTASQRGSNKSWRSILWRRGVKRISGYTHPFFTEGRKWRRKHKKTVSMLFI